MGVQDLRKAAKIKNLDDQAKNAAKILVDDITQMLVTKNINELQRLYYFTNRWLCELYYFTINKMAMEMTDEQGEENNKI